MIGYAVLLVFLLLTGLFGYAYYVQYFKWRACFDEVGRCLTRRLARFTWSNRGPRGWPWRLRPARGPFFKPTD